MKKIEIENGETKTYRYNRKKHLQAANPRVTVLFNLKEQKNNFTYKNGDVEN